MSEEMIPQNQGEITIMQLENKIELLEAQLQRQAEEINSLSDRIPDSNIISPNFLKRAFTVWGHYVVAGFIIAIPFMCLSMLFVLMLAFLGEYSY
jgi:hypothetical protein